MDSHLSSLPLYAQVEASIAADIASGALPVEGQLPPEDRLIAKYGVSRTTLRKAIENLVARRLVEIRRGSGTFVTRPQLRQELTELTGFAEDMIALGKSPSSKLLDKKVVEADEVVAERLRLLKGTSVYRITRLRVADGIAMSFDETYLPLDIGGKVVENDLDAEPIFALLEGKYDVPLLRADYELEATVASEPIASALGIAPGSPVFLIDRTTYSDADRPVDYERLYYRGDLIRFATRLQRRKPA
ncbi:GntR family transcriptional regulator [Luteibacter aegosomaticola]|uniref:GntR family transcriptional regulator n=1 Tax=Luteibacter aegosomaticola TaxID=2911538 RepID=UPI001FF9EEBB|nr:GntR family transcriptional regulator [Luteibacter aegosomaticola]UPG90545.1 GntR family transcriptional regulator [Luteibacter aegosomaticola]